MGGHLFIEVFEDFIFCKRRVTVAFAEVRPGKLEMLPGGGLEFWVDLEGFFYMGYHFIMSAHAGVDICGAEVDPPIFRIAFNGGSDVRERFILSAENRVIESDDYKFIAGAASSES